MNWECSVVDFQRLSLLKEDWKKSIWSRCFWSDTRAVDALDMWSYVHNQFLQTSIWPTEDGSLASTWPYYSTLPGSIIKSLQVKRSSYQTTLQIFKHLDRESVNTVRPSSWTNSWWSLEPECLSIDGMIWDEKILHDGLVNAYWASTLVVDLSIRIWPKISIVDDLLEIRSRIQIHWTQLWGVSVKLGRTMLNTSHMANVVAFRLYHQFVRLHMLWKSLMLSFQMCGIKRYHSRFFLPGPGQQVVVWGA